MSPLESDGFLPTLLLVNVIVVVIGSLVLMICMPTRLRTRLLREGGWAEGWTSILLLLGLSLIPMNLVVVYVHWRVIPVPMAVDAVRRFDPDPARFRENIERDSRGNLRTEHVRLLQDQGMDAASAHELQRTLWSSWPLWFVAGGFLAILSALAISRAYAQLLKDLSANAEKRQLQRRVPAAPWERTFDDLLRKKDEARKHHRRS